MKKMTMFVIAALACEPVLAVSPAPAQREQPGALEQLTAGAFDAASPRESGFILAQDSYWEQQQREQAQAEQDVRDALLREESQSTDYQRGSEDYGDGYEDSGDGYESGGSRIISNDGRVTEYDREGNVSRECEGAGDGSGTMNCR